MSGASIPTVRGVFERLEEKERAFRPPDALVPALEKVREFLREELADSPAEGMSLARAGLTLAAAWGGEVSTERMIPLASGVEMIYHALTVQQSAIHPEGGADLFGILSQDLVLARALDLYTSDGNPKVMDAVSRGAAHLCEALMAGRAGEPFDLPLRYLTCFHVACARVGWAAAGMDEEREREGVHQVKGIFHESLGGTKGNSPFMPNGHESGADFLGDYLLRWLTPEG